MSPEYGATATMFPVDDETLRYMQITGRPAETIELAEAYAKAQGLFRTDADPDPEFNETLELDLATVVPSLAGPRRPQDRVELGSVAGEFREHFVDGLVANGAGPHYEPVDVTVDGDDVPAPDRLGGDRRHHQLHQHLQPVGDGRRRPARQEGGGEGPRPRRRGSRRASPPAPAS